MNKTYSIVIQCYNDQEYLNKLLLSIPDFFNIQIIIIDDYSLIPIICTRLFKQAQMEIHRNIQNYGYGYNRSMGILYSKNDYIIFIDCDDIFLSNSFEYYDNLEYDLLISAPKEANIPTQAKVNCLNGACIKRSIITNNNIDSLKKCSYFEDVILLATIISHAKNVIWHNGIWSDPKDRSRSFKQLRHEYTYDFLDYCMMVYMLKPYMNNEIQQEAKQKIITAPMLKSYNFPELNYLKIYYRSLFDSYISIDRKLYYLLLSNFFKVKCGDELPRLQLTLDEYLKEAL